jgi:hypothetical protein
MPQKATMTKRPKSCDASQYRHGCDPTDHGDIVSPQTNMLFQDADTFRRDLHAIRHVLMNVLAAYVLVSGLVGCGPVPSDYEQAGAPVAISSGGDVSETPGVRGEALQTGLVSEADGSVAGNGRSNEPSVEQLPMGTGMMDRGDPRLPSNKWNAMSGNLNPSDANARYGAMAENRGSESGGLRTAATAPMEREGPAAGAKAPMTLEQYLARQLQVNGQEE